MGQLLSLPFVLEWNWIYNLWTQEVKKNKHLKYYCLSGTYGVILINIQIIMNNYRNTFNTFSVSDKVVVICFLIIVIIMTSSCRNSPGKDPEKKLRQEAERICQTNLILDSHIDWPDFVLANPKDISLQTSNGDFDW
jgi:hypothetical protein